MREPCGMPCNQEHTTAKISCKKTWLGQLPTRHGIRKIFCNEDAVARLASQNVQRLLFNKFRIVCIIINCRNRRFANSRRTT